MNDNSSADPSATIAKAELQGGKMEEVPSPTSPERTGKRTTEKHTVVDTATAGKSPKRSKANANAKHGDKDAATSKALTPSSTKAKRRRANGEGSAQVTITSHTPSHTVCVRRGREGKTLELKASMDMGETAGSGTSGWTFGAVTASMIVDMVIAFAEARGKTSVSEDALKNVFAAVLQAFHVNTTPEEAYALFEARRSLDAPQTSGTGPVPLDLPEQHTDQPASNTNDVHDVNMDDAAT